MMEGARDFQCTRRSPVWLEDKVGFRSWGQTAKERPDHTAKHVCTSVTCVRLTRVGGVGSGDCQALQPGVIEAEPRPGRVLPGRRDSPGGDQEEESW